MAKRAGARFGGFPPGKVRFTSIPEPFFSDLLGQVDSLNELKVTLYIFWALGQRDGRIRYLRRSELLADDTLLQGLEPEKANLEATLDFALTACIQRGSLLEVHPDGDEDRYYLLNTENSRAVYQNFLAGKWKPGQEKYLPVSLERVKPNIFQLYEQNIGPLTPLIAEKLKLAEQEYPQEWLDDAFRIAVTNNIRKWNYIDAVLKSWQERGKDDNNRRDAQTNYRRYTEGEFARFIEH
jgi:DNA replication protein